jgi:hypothetical protein
VTPECDNEVERPLSDVDELLLLCTAVVEDDEADTGLSSPLLLPLLEFEVLEEVEPLFDEPLFDEPLLLEETCSSLGSKNQNPGHYFTIERETYAIFVGVGVPSLGLQKMTNSSDSPTETPLEGFVARTL